MSLFKIFTEIDEIMNSISLKRDVWEDEISGTFDKEMKGKYSRSFGCINKRRIKILVKTYNKENYETEANLAMDTLQIYCEL